MAKQAETEQRVLLINGFNFLGDHLIDSLANLPLNITIIDRNLTPGYISRFSKFKNVEIIAYNQFFKNDLRNQRYDVIVYNSLYEEGQKSELVDTIGNVKNLLNKAKIDVTPFYLLSDVNNSSKNQKISAYISMLTDLCEEYMGQGLHGKILFMGEIYGPGMNTENGSPLSGIIKSSVREAKVSVQGDELFIYYLYIDDAIQGILHAFDVESDGEFTIADPFDLSLTSLGVRIAEITGKELSNKVKAQAQDHLKTLPYILPGWRPITSIEKGLENTFTWIKETGIIKQNGSLVINNVTNENLLNPIRNYQSEKNITDRIVPEQPDKEPEEPITPLISPKEMSPSQALSYKGNVRSINDLKSRIGDVGTQEEKTHHINDLLDNLSVKLSTNKNNDVNFGEYYKKGKKVFFIIPIIIFLLLIIGLVIPIGILAYGYHNAQLGLSDISNINTKKTEDGASNMKQGLTSLHWLFILTKQDDRFTNAMQTIQSIQDIAVAQESFLAFKSPIDKIKESFSKQDMELTDIVTHFPTNSDSLIVSNELIKTNNDLDSYNPYLPGDQLKMKELISKNLLSLTNINNSYVLFPTLLQGQTHYLVLVTNNNATPIPLLLDEISLTNGIYNGITPLPLPKTIKGETINEISQNIEQGYTGPFNGFIMIDQGAISNIYPQQTTAITNESLAMFIKQVIQSPSKVQNNAIEQSISQNDIEFFINNETLTNNDIIHCIFE